MRESDKSAPSISAHFCLQVAVFLAVTAKSAVADKSASGRKTPFFVLVPFAKVAPGGLQFRGGMTILYGSAGASCSNRTRNEVAHVQTYQKKTRKITKQTRKPTHANKRQ